MLTYSDECHHAAADSAIEVLQELTAQYVYGVTATPKRGDGKEKINEFLLGPVRYRFTAKDRAEEQTIVLVDVPFRPLHRTDKKCYDDKTTPKPPATVEYE